MALTFAVKQNEHGRSILALDQSIDTTLIARSMVEGLSQLLWAAQSPDERPLRWRTFPFVFERRRMLKRQAAGESIPREQQEAIEEGLKQYGAQFFTGKAREAQAKGSVSANHVASREHCVEQDRASPLLHHQPLVLLCHKMT